MDKKIENINVTVEIEHDENFDCDVISIMGTKADGEKSDIFRIYDREYGYFTSENKYWFEDEKRHEIYETATQFCDRIYSFLKWEINEVNGHNAKIGNIDDIPDLRIMKRFGGLEQAGLFIKGKIVVEIPEKISNLNQNYEIVKVMNDAIFEHVMGEIDGESNN